ncbi:adenosylcobinamide-GDP ribazoletransferase [Methanobacterium petrolearium]|uniref:adenosylcobinamide-GDP ribazoletransferase n=1 Tax=Methanobacterium petrolearium TaxID=710190 RepID=UPI001AEAEB23|nr:adenosylcobinamide-GDP ribazoletransferase [Methanobacterium petrolearium]MBP1945833.1 adenosylcobinamide-GDP ribazoletransferase [Methanobacterium petrolearium]BDZ69617.1 adenosylcobinamide-GDP ribazoletransferase [Methanobacterium petrolearium]
MNSSQGKDTLSDTERNERAPLSWQGFMGLISFSTILPLNIHSTIPEMARFTFLWPLIGAFIGIIVGGFGWLILDPLHLPQLLSAALIYTLAISFTGFHHLDGLVDFGDGLMAHGDPERRIEIMRDKRIGTGGLANLLTVSLITFTAVTTIPPIYILTALFTSEIAAKTSLVSCATFSKSLDDGTGQYFVKNMNCKLLTVSIIFALLLGFLAFSYIGVVGIVGGVVAGLIMVLITRRSFKYTTGDILGASNEIGRMLSLVVMVIFISWGF